jgi:single-strand DNA-binding protein
MYLNKALIIGNLTRDPELRATAGGTQVATFSLATNSVYKDKDGSKKETTEYHNIVVFGRAAENAAQYLKKGDQAYVEGRMQTRSWEQDGQKKYRTEVVADRVQFGNKGGGGGAGGGAPRQGDAGAGKSAPDTGGSIEYPQEDINPEDIPF